MAKNESVDIVQSAHRLYSQHEGERAIDTWGYEQLDLSEDRKSAFGSFPNRNASSVSPTRIKRITGFYKQYHTSKYLLSYHTFADI